jgi:hypothetical protein
MVIDRAAGSKMSAPSFVTPDFERSATIALDFERSTAVQSDAGVVEDCPSHTVLNAHVDFTARDYSQAMQRGEDHCPDIPISK